MTSTMLIFIGMKVFVREKFPDAGPVEHLLKLKQEVDEAIAEPTDLTEYADCLLALFGAAGKAGFTYTELMAAAEAKLQLVKNRKWERNDDGTYQHIKE